MALKNLFDMVKADRYTADGREAIIKAQDEVTEDAKAKPEGSVSPDGKRIKQGGKWVPKKDAKQPGAKQNTAAGGKPDATPETKPAETTTKFETEQENAKYEEGKKGWETVSKERLPDIKKKVEQKIDYYKKYDPYAMLGKRTGLNAQQKKAVEQNIAQAKENLAFFTGQLEGINKQMGASGPAESKPAESNRENRINEYWRKIRKETQPVVRMAAELDRGTFDDDVINTMGDVQSMEDLARSLISPAFEDDGYIPQNKLDTARKIIRKRYRALESDATDAAPRVLTGDTRIRVRKA